MTLPARTSVAAFGLTASLFLVALPAAAADEGQVAFNNHCRTCHSTKQGDNRMGLSLYKIYGAKAGASSGYSNYSQALASAGITWDEATLDRFIENPEHAIPNNNMKPYSGINDAAVRKQIVAFLKSGGGDS